MPGDGRALVHKLAIAVQATEAARFSVDVRDGAIALGQTLDHVRPDDSTPPERAEAVRAFRQIVDPCLRQDQDGAIEVGRPDDGYAQFCLVLRRQRRGLTFEFLAFITRCMNQTEARRKLVILRDAAKDR